MKKQVCVKNRLTLNVKGNHAIIDLALRFLYNFVKSKIYVYTPQKYKHISRSPWKLFGMTCVKISLLIKIVTI